MRLKNTGKRARRRKDGRFMSLNGRGLKASSQETTQSLRGIRSKELCHSLKSMRGLENEKINWTWGVVATLEAYSDSKILLLDFDRARPTPRITPILARLRVLGLRAKWSSLRRTKRGWHMEVGVNFALTTAEQVATQAVLGSDLAREAMNLRRAISLRVHKHSPFWKKRWNILFQEKLK